MPRTAPKDVSIAGRAGALRAGGMERGVQRQLDWMVLAVVALCCLGLVLAVSISGPRPGVGAFLAMKSQGAKLAVGLVAFLVAAAVPIDWLWRHARLAFLVTTGLVFAAAIVGVGSHGAHRWLAIGGFRFQPVDLARLATILYLARVINDAGDHLKEFKRGTLAVMLPTLCLVAGLLFQPDNGNAVFILALCTCMAVVAGVRLVHFALLAIPGLIALAAIAAQRSYVVDRVIGFLEPERGGQVWQSKVAIASGGLFGRGLGDGWMKMGFVPEADNDFVFAVVGEELGFLGAATVVALYAVIGVIGIRLVLHTQERFLRVLILGLTVALCMQASINLLVVTGLAPAKGIDLPFLSSGGTSLVTCLAAVGLIGNAARADARIHPERT